MTEPLPAPTGHDPPPPGARLMNVVRWALFAGLLLLAAVSIGAYVASCRSGGVASQKQARYHCPMHPTYTSDRPGECPICGMNLEPIPTSAAGSSGAAGDVPGLTAVELSPDRVQMIGVRTARVERRPLGERLELVGFVAPDEARMRRVQVRVSGWVQELFVNQTGERVRDGQPLLTLYSPELYQSEQEFLIESHGLDSSAQHHGGGGPASVRERLRLLGVPEAEIVRLATERVATKRLLLRSPVVGTVLERGVTQGQFVSADTPLLTVADLSRLWVLADVYEMDFTRVRPGDPARFTADGLPGRVFSTRVDFVYPTVSAETRTVKVRLRIDNSDGALRPGMYGRVVVSGRAAPVAAIPGEAVVRTGEETYVFLIRNGSRFEPRRVTLGGQDGDWIQVRSGVALGDTVVASASFLIDSESRLKAAIEGMSGAGAAGGTPASPHH